MTRRTLGLCIGGAGLFGLFLGTAAGCGNMGSVPVGQAAGGATQAAAATVAGAATTVAGAASAVASGAGTSSQSSQRPDWTRPKKVHGLKRNGRGGYDVSQQQKNALRLSHAIAKHYGTINRTPRRPATSQPTTRPARNG
jgi:hypothetical protein